MELKYKEYEWIYGNLTCYICNIDKHVQYFYPTLDYFLKFRYLFSGDVHICKDTKYLCLMHKKCTCGEELLSGCALYGINCKKCNQYYRHDQFTKKK
jgi:hypothetical protein